MTAGLLALLLQSAVWGSTLPEAAPAGALEPLLREGDAHHDAWEYESAREAYERALAVVPDSSDARERLAHVLNDIGESAVAESQSVGAKGDEERERALATEATRSFERARDLARELQEARPDRAEGQYWYAASLANLTPRATGPEKVRFAREIDAATRRAIALDPCFAAGWAALGVATRELARIGWFVRGVARAALGGLPPASLEEAEGMLRAAIALDPSDPFPLYQLALTLEALDRPSEALDALERALALPDREERDRRNRKDVNERLRRLRSAVGSSTRRDLPSPPEDGGLLHEPSESGRFEAYVPSLEDDGGKWRISTEGGSNGGWTPEGREVAFQAGEGQLMAVEVTSSRLSPPGSPRPLFDPRTTGGRPD